GDSAAQSEWALVPFLVKRPDQHEGEISDAPVANIDIVPTILQAAGLLTDAASDPRLEGFPLDQAPPDRLRRVFLSGKNIPLAADLLEERDRILAWKLATFGDGSDPDAIYQKASPRPDLLGRPIASLPPNPTGLRIVLDDAEGATKTFSYDPASRWIPTLVKGTVISERALTEPGPVVAIAVDGIIRATVRAHAVEEGRWRFEVLVPEEAVSAGSLLTVQLVSDLPVTADAG
ncbi:MAG: hypothetical protein KDD11_12010, partial [Acidobacteria bacterium]|nr:hypothetical protein [Acidobacteriota bacterium]